MTYLATFGGAVLFILVVSLDLFVCGFGYGAGKTHVPFKKVLAINVIGACMIAAGLFVGFYLGSLISHMLTRWLAFSVLMALGLFKIIWWSFTQNKDENNNKSLVTWKETIILGIALSLDGLVVAVGTTLDMFGLTFIFTVIVLALLTANPVFSGGQWLGRKVTKKIRLDLSWLGGLLLMALGIIGLFI